MDSSQAKEKIRSKGDVEKSADPFASDIFAAPRVEENIGSETAPESEVKSPPAWVRRLPKAARPTIDWNALQRKLPPDFSADLPPMLADTLAKYLNVREDDTIEFLFLIEREVAGIVGTDAESWWLTVGIEPGETEFAIEISDVFAVWLTDAAIGERKSGVVQVRESTPSEIAVLEFLAVNLTHEANKIINAPLFKFRGLSRKIPDWTSQTNAAENFLLVANWQTVHGFLNSIVKLYITPHALNALNAEENILLTAAPRREIIWNSLHNRVKDIRTRLLFGAVPLTLGEVAGLETGDVVLPENYNFSIVNSEFTGSADVLLSDGDQIKIVGEFMPAANESPAEVEKTDGDDDKALVRRVKSNHTLRIVVERFEESDSPQLLEKLMSNEEIQQTEQIAEFGEGSGISLENLAVTLRVELEARRLSLAEVGNLRINQIIELGVSAADPVNLLIENKVVARGELVEVEDRLGVRIIQILR